MKVKKVNAGLIPYLWNEGRLRVYMQMRSADVSYYPNHFGFFGGGVEEGETPEEGIRRETQEELGYTLNTVVPFKHYELDTYTFHVFLIEVTEDFPSEVLVQEGQYGQFIDEVDFDVFENVIPKNREILKDLKVFLSEKAR